MENEKNKNKITLYIILALILGGIVGTIGATAAFTARPTRIVIDNASGNTKMDAIWQLVEQNYVDNIDNDSVMDRVYATMLAALDPHSVYLSGKDLKREVEALRGNFEGVGILLRMKDDTVCAQQIIAGSPAQAAGVMAADRIVAVDGRNVTGKETIIDSVVSMIRGPRKSTVKLTIRRPGENAPVIFKVVRDVIPTPSLAYSGMINATTGYIRLDRFAETTYDEFCYALVELKRKGMNHLVLDLRDNGGGLMEAAIGICDELLPGRELIVYTQGAHQRRREEHSRPGGLFCKGKLTVLIDEYSASASEIVAGAIQDNDRGIIAGRRSFGKGLVQQQFDLPDHSAARITIARYYTPSGRCIQRPYDKGTDEYYSDFIQSLVDEYKGDSLLAHINDSTPYYTTKGRIVYGGGGIYPDHTIHYKTDENIVYYNQLINKNIINDYAFDIVSSDGRNIVAQHPTEESFVSNYTISEAMLQKLFARGEKAGIKRDAKCISRYRNEISSRLKASIGVMLYSQSAFFAIQLKYDPELKEALNIKKEL